MTDMKKIALDYLRKFGFNVFPCGKDKRPLVKWKVYQDERVTPKLVREWWQKWPDANIAIVTGKISDLLVLDADTVEGEVALKAMLNGSNPTVKTPGGVHWYFRHPKGEPISIGARFIPGCDFRSQGGYVVGPRSIKEDGSKWSQLLSFNARKDVPYEVLYLLYRKSNYEREDGPPGENPPVSQSVPESHNPSQSVSKRPNRWLKGQRDETLFHYANGMIKGGLPPYEVREALEILAQKCDPPYDPDQIQTKIESAMNRSVSRTEGIMSELKRHLESQKGLIRVAELRNALHCVSRAEKSTLRSAIQRLATPGPLQLLEPTGSIVGEYRVLTDLQGCVDWQNCVTAYCDLAMPWGLMEMAHVAAGSMINIMGSVNSGKTSLCTWLAVHNCHNWKVNYLSTETSASLFKDLTDYHTQVNQEHFKNIRFYEDLVLDELKDYVTDKPGELWILDYLDITKDFHQIGEIIKQLHVKLRGGGVMVVATQKKVGQDDAIGGHYNRMKPHIAMGLEYNDRDDLGKVKLEKVKIPNKDWMIMNHSHGITGRQCVYQWQDNHRYVIKSKPAWSYPITEEK